MFGFRVGPVGVDLDAPQGVAGGPVVADLAADHAAPLLLHVSGGVDQHLVLIGAVGGPVHAAAIDADIAAAEPVRRADLDRRPILHGHVGRAGGARHDRMTAAAARTIFFMSIPCPRSGPWSAKPANFPDTASNTLRRRSVTPPRSRESSYVSRTELAVAAAQHSLRNATDAE